MKAKWRRRGRGAISIFLIIIFLAQYVLCGLLVDGARQRMASAMAESALDSASMSVLSYYNQLVNDLYGLMATDGLTEDAVRDKLKSYVDRTLGTQEVSNTLVQTIMGLFDATVNKGFDGYDFQYTVTAQPHVTLANTDFVEYQLIEHMKYRAPVLMLTENGFLNKLGNLAEVADRLSMAKKKTEISKKYKDNAQNASDTLKKTDEFIKLVNAYLSDPVGWDGSKTADSAPAAAPNIKPIADEITSRAEAMAEDYLEEWDAYRVQYELFQEEQENPSESDPSAGASPEPAEPTWLRDDWLDGVMPLYGTNHGNKIKGLNDALTQVEMKYAKIIGNAALLKDKADALIAEIDSEVAKYKSCSNELNAAYDAKGTANAATVYLPEADLAEANAGQLLKNRPFLSYISTFAGEIEAEGTGNLHMALDQIVNGGGSHGLGMGQDLVFSMDQVEGFDPDKDYELPDVICGKVSNEVTAAEWGVLPGNLKQMLLALESDAIPNVAPADVNVKVKSNDAKEEVKKDEPETDSLRDINKDDLKITYQTLNAADAGSLDGMTLGDDLADDGGEQLLNAAGGILDFLMGLLEGARDNLYVNQYITYYFPNYVDNYRLLKPSAGVPPSPSSEKFNAGKEYADYCASQAEVEYVLTGIADGKGNVLAVQAMLLGVRTAFNLVAIFTDSAKISQANAIAAAAGPFAPAVAIALLIGWALAESIIDVQKLCSGEEVPLFKQGKDWTLSIGGAADAAVKAAVSAAVDYGMDAVKKKVSSLTGKVQNVANQAIFKAYDAASSSVDNGVNAAKGVFAEWDSNLDETLDPSASAEVKGALHSVRSEFENGLNTLNSSVTKELSDKKDIAVQKVAHASEKVTKKANEKLTNLGGKLTDKVVDSLVSWTSDKLPIGDVVSLEKAESSKFPGLTYMDYIQIFLLMQNQTTKVQRIQSLVQANIRYKESGGDPDKDDGKKFLMENSYGALSAHLEGSIKFLFMSESFIPASLRQSGRLKISSYSMVSY